MALLLLTGATIAGVVHALRTGLLGTGRALRDSTAQLRALHRRGDASAFVAEGESLTPPEPGDRELVVKATHVEAPPLDAATRFPDLFGRTEDAASEDAPTAEERLADEREKGLEPDDAEVVEVIEDEPDEPGVTRRDDAPDPAVGTRPHSSITDDPGFDWRVPQSKLLTRSTAAAAKPDTTGQEKTAAALLEALGHFGVDAKVVGTVTGPHITRYELRLAPGTKVAKVAQLKDDLAYALAATEIRILAPIPGKQAVGVEVPNQRRRIVHLGDVFQDPPADWSPLSVWLGKDVSGKAIGADLARMPHLLVAGTTGAGKSGAINAMLASILLRATPHEVRLVLVDPKQVELNHYDSIPHLLTPVITSPRMAANALGNLVREMETRYGEMSIARTRSLVELNRVRVGRGDHALPYVLCVIDELADLMMVAPADVEDAVIRLAQKARAVGIHLVLATQSPRVDVITGMIKANVPSRIAFAVSSQTDSRVILDQNGAESLLGMGDMLFPAGDVQAPAHSGRLRGRGADRRNHRLLAPPGRAGIPRGAARGGRVRGRRRWGRRRVRSRRGPAAGDAIALVAQMGTASTSMLQRRLRLGYTRAGRLIDMLERRGVISGYEGSKPRQVLITEGDVPRVLANLAEVAGRGSPWPPSRTTRSGAPAERAAGKLERLALDSSPDAGDRRDPARGAHAREDRRLRSRGGDEDPRQVPPRAGERGVGAAARAHVRALLSAHLRRLPRPRLQAARGGVSPAARASLRARPRPDLPQPRTRAPRVADQPAPPVARLDHRPVGGRDHRAPDRDRFGRRREVRAGPGGDPVDHAEGEAQSTRPGTAPDGRAAQADRRSTPSTCAWSTPAGGG